MNSRAFRFQPGAPPPERTIPRQRLTSVLQQRFSVRLTIVCGVAGAGKSTALAQAITSNHLDPLGTDLWLGLGTRDVEPARLLSGLATVVGLGESPSDQDEAIDLIADEVWRQSPDEVTIIIDDVHHLGPDAMMVVRELLEALPTNGHLLLAGRWLPDGLQVARMRAHATLCEVTEDDLAFSDDDLTRLRALREDVGSVPALEGIELPRHPATADLALAAGIDAGTDFLWEEVLSLIPSDRLEALTFTSVLDDFDDEVALAVSEGSFRAAELTDGLPMVAVNDSGRTSLHSLLRTALGARLSPGHAIKAARLGAQAEIARLDHIAAARLLANGVDDDGVVDIARSYMYRPVLRSPVDDIASMTKMVTEAAPGSPLSRLYECLIDSATDPSFDYFRYQQVAEDARINGDDELEAAALHRRIQAQSIQTGQALPELRHRLRELGDTVSFARGVSAYYDSVWLQHVGQPEDALAAIADLDVLDPELRVIQRAERFVDLGHPEQASRHVGIDDLATMPPGTEIFQAFAMWLRGETSPEVGEAIAFSMMGPTLGRGHPDAVISFLGVATMVALNAGLNDVAQARATRTQSLQHQGPPMMAAFGGLADAAVALVIEGEEKARRRLEVVLTELPLLDSPHRAHLIAVPLIYTLAPATRSLLDRWPFGPALSIAVQAGQALAAARENADGGPAAALPWHEQNILRTHVLPPHLCELAATAAAAGVSAAVDLIDQLPNRRDLYERVAKGESKDAAAWCQRQLELLPARPRQTISAQTLGELVLTRGGTPVEDNDWVRRRRVRELFSILIEMKHLSRFETTELLWPDQDGDKATTSLRTTLSYLRRVLEPDRAKNEASFYLLTEGDMLQLSEEIEVDKSRFETQIESARRIDQSGSPADALDAHIAALSLYKGPYLREIEQPWVVSTRLRLQSLATAANCRVGELTLARGEPEEACRWAVQARALDRLNERSARLFISSLAATGDRSAAVRAGRAFHDELMAAGLGLSPDTAKLIDRLQH